MWYHHQMSKMSPKAEQRRSEATASAMSGHGTVLRRRRWRRRGRTGSELTGRVGSAAQERRRRLVERRPRRSAFWSRRSEPGLVVLRPHSSFRVRSRRAVSELYSALNDPSAAVVCGGKITDGAHQLAIHVVVQF